MLFGTFAHRSVNLESLSVSNLHYYLSHLFDEIIKTHCSIWA